MRLTYIGHSTVHIDLDGTRLLTDPLLRNRIAHLRRQGKPLDRERPLEERGVDAVLISHLHWDHLDLPSLRRLGHGTRLIVPRGAGTLFRRNGFREVEELAPGGETRVGSLDVRATVAHHSGFRPPFGPTAETLGFLVRGSRHLYFAGDTDLFSEMGALPRNLDVALLPVWGWGPTLGEGHMDPRRAAEALTLLRPRSAVPIHWGTFCPVGVGWRRPRFLHEPPHRFADHAASLAPEVDVRIAPPGGEIHFDG